MTTTFVNIYRRHNELPDDENDIVLNKLPLQMTVKCNQKRYELIYCFNKYKTKLINYNNILCDLIKDGVETRLFYFTAINKLYNYYCERTTNFFNDYTTEDYTKMIFLASFRLIHKFIDDDQGLVYAKNYNLQSYIDEMRLNIIEVYILQVINYNLFKFIKN